MPGKESRAGGAAVRVERGGATFQAEPEQHVQKTKSEKGMKYLWKSDMFHVSEAPLISVRIRNDSCIYNAS